MRKREEVWTITPEFEAALQAGIQKVLCARELRRIKAQQKRLRNLARAAEAALASRSANFSWPLAMTRRTGKNGNKA
jgi:hypothetical protein